LAILFHAPPTSPLFPYTTLFRSFFAARGFLLYFAFTARRVRNFARLERFFFARVRVWAALCLEKLRAMSLPSVASCFSERALARSEEHTSELQSRGHLVCRLLLE